MTQATPAPRAARVALVVFWSVLVFGVGHFAGIVATAVARGGFVYDFRFYSMGMLGALMVVPSAIGLRQWPGLRRRDPAARRSALRVSLLLLGVTLPMLPMQNGRTFVIFGSVIACLAGAATLSLALGRAEFRETS